MEVTEFQLSYLKILKDDAVKVLHSVSQQIWKTQQWALGSQAGVSCSCGACSGAAGRHVSCLITETACRGEGLPGVNRHEAGMPNVAKSREGCLGECLLN